MRLFQFKTADAEPFKGKVIVRKVGQNLPQVAYTGIFAGMGLGKLAMMIPAPLLRLLGWKKGQRFKVKVTSDQVALTIRRTSSSTAKIMPRKQSGAERVQFASKWNRQVRLLKKNKRARAL